MPSLLLEIFCEELPHGSMDPDQGECRKILTLLEENFKNHQLYFSKSQFFLTPRRIATLFSGLPEKLESKKIITKGPPVKISFQEGIPTSVFTGFSKSFFNKNPQIKTINNLDNLKELDEEIDGFYKKKYGKDDFVIYFHNEKTKDTKDVLKEILPNILKKISFNKSMYWGEKQGPFLRPIKSLLALLGKETIHFSFIGISSSNTTQGHPFLSSKKIIINSADDYEKILFEHHVIANPWKRLETILQQVETIEKKLNLEAMEKNKVAKLVSNLTEYPIAICTQIDPQLINIPQEVVVSEMIQHQMYFPTKKNGELSPNFIFTCNGISGDKVIQGNQNVLSARLYDGIFLYQEDKKIGIEALSQKANAMLFEKTLGSYEKKSQRIKKIANLDSLTVALGLTSKQKSNDILKEKISLTARLLKSDLASGMVYEFPQLQGIMGEYYAKETLLKNGNSIDKEITATFREHYLPLSTKGDLPQTNFGCLFALAEKIDNIMGLFAVGLLPTGNNDPYALRRQGYGIVRIIIEKKLFFCLHKVFESCYSIYQPFLKKETSLIKDILGFIKNRTITYFKDFGFTSDEIEASFTGEEFNLYQQFLCLKAISEFKNKKSFLELITLLKRITNIVDGKVKAAENLMEMKILKKEYFIEKEEIFLFEKYCIIEKEIVSLIKKHDYSNIFKTFQDYQIPLKNFFDNVLVNTEDSHLRESRHLLLNSIKKQITYWFDFNKIKIPG